MRPREFIGRLGSSFPSGRAGRRLNARRSSKLSCREREGGHLCPLTFLQPYRHDVHSLQLEKVGAHTERMTKMTYLSLAHLVAETRILPTLIVTADEQNDSQHLSPSEIDCGRRIRANHADRSNNPRGTLCFLGA
jgi:hypothetical protein